MDKRILITALVSAVGGGLIGGTITYLTVKKTFAERAQKDIDDVKRTYREKFDGKRVVNDYGNMPGPASTDDIDVTRPGANLSPEDLKAAADFVERLGYASVEKTEVEDVHVSIYDQIETPPEGVEEVDPRLRNYDKLELKEKHKPFLISHEEFQNTENEWDKSSIVYYEDDDTLVDEREMPIDDIEYLIGEQHLDFFGVQSGDPNQVFVRNPQISTDFEITRNLGSYTEMVLHIPRGSDKVGTRRMRGNGDDD